MKDHDVDARFAAIVAHWDAELPEELSAAHPASRVTERADGPSETTGQAPVRPYAGEPGREACDEDDLAGGGTDDALTDRGHGDRDSLPDRTDRSDAPGLTDLDPGASASGGSPAAGAQRAGKVEDGGADGDAADGHAADGGAPRTPRSRGAEAILPFIGPAALPHTTTWRATDRSREADGPELIDDLRELDAAAPVDDGLADHFEPPEVTLPPQEDLHYWGAVVGLVAGPLALLYVVLARPFYSGWWLLAALTLTIGGFALLVLRQPVRDDGTDDGIRL